MAWLIAFLISPEFFILAFVALFLLIFTIASHAAQIIKAILAVGCLIYGSFIEPDYAPITLAFALGLFGWIEHDNKNLPPKEEKEEKK